MKAKDKKKEEVLNNPKFRAIYEVKVVWDICHYMY